MLSEGKTSVEVKEDAFLRYNEALDKEASNLLLMHRRSANPACILRTIVLF